MKRVYIVTSGCYSDYSIRAVFSRREDAEALVQEWRDRNDYKARECAIEEWPLDDEVPPDARHRRFYVSLSEDGDTFEVTDKHKSGDPIGEVGWWGWYDAYELPLPSTSKRIEFRGSIWARDVDHAIKIARDARAASIAAGDLDRLKALGPTHWRHVAATHAE